MFSLLLKQLLKDGTGKGEVVAVDSTAVKAYSQRSLDNKSGKSDLEACFAEALFHLAEMSFSRHPIPVAANHSQVAIST